MILYETATFYSTNWPTIFSVGLGQEWSTIRNRGRHGQQVDQIPITFSSRNMTKTTSGHGLIMPISINLI